MAGDYEKYCGEDNTKYHEAYMAQLGAWCDSEYAVPQVQILYEYLQQNTLITDLIEAGIFSQDEKGMLTKNWGEGFGEADSRQSGGCLSSVSGGQPGREQRFVGEKRYSGTVFKILLKSWRQTRFLLRDREGS